MKERYTVPVAECFSDFIDAAVCRLAYLYPMHSFSGVGHSIQIEIDPESTPAFNEEALRKDVYHQIYRERIYRETLPMRKWFYENESK